jgi:iron complex outermembrane recepter protein
VNGSAHRDVPVALDVVDGRELERQDARTLSSVLNGSVAGVWVWEQAPTSLLARYASIRGASLFGISYPKSNLSSKSSRAWNAAWTYWSRELSAFT